MANVGDRRDRSPLALHCADFVIDGTEFDGELGGMLTGCRILTMQTEGLVDRLWRVRSSLAAQEQCEPEDTDDPCGDSNSGLHDFDLLHASHVEACLKKLTIILGPCLVSNVSKREANQSVKLAFKGREKLRQFS